MQLPARLGRLRRYLRAGVDLLGALWRLAHRRR
jgi:hypothetical protein